jgi:hypothetical protein
MALEAAELREQIALALYDFDVRLPGGDMIVGAAPRAKAVPFADAHHYIREQYLDRADAVLQSLHRLGLFERGQL